MSVYEQDWGYKIYGTFLYLFELDDTGAWVAPTDDITDGLKITYIAGENVFVDSSGNADDASPSETSVLNCSDTECNAVIAYVKARLAEEKKEFKEMEYWDRQFDVKLARAREALQPGIKVAVTSYPYAIR